MFNLLGRLKKLFRSESKEAPLQTDEFNEVETLDEICNTLQATIDGLNWTVGELTQKINSNNARYASIIFAFVAQAGGEVVISADMLDLVNSTTTEVKARNEENGSLRFYLGEKSEDLEPEPEFLEE